MKIAIVALSACGAHLASTFITGLETSEHYSVQGYLSERHCTGAEHAHFTPFDSVRELTAKLFNTTDALVFIGACGIAVRAIAPHVASKLTDPAVVVCDETGRFAISLLSGHVGGANELAEHLASLAGAVPVVTTASDSHALLEGKDEPQNLVLGIGCRRGLAPEAIERAATIMLWDKQIPLSRVTELATITVKRDDAGLLGFAQAHQLPLHFYTAEELAAVEGSFSHSERVLAEVGVDNVCERAAVLLGKRGTLIMEKTTRDGVAVALFEKE